MRENNGEKKVFKKAFLLLFSACLFLGVYSAQAFEPGKTYDQTNYQEIENLLIPIVSDWVQQGAFPIKTGKPQFEFKWDDSFYEGSQKNEGRFTFSAGGALIEKDTGELYGEYFGIPFPNVDLKDPRAAQMIMENRSGSQRRNGSNLTNSKVCFFGHDATSPHMVILADGHGMVYDGVPGQSVLNPSGFKGQYMFRVLSPYDLRGLNSMTWSYKDDKPDTFFTYVPMLRRVRRVSASAKSEPSFGGDIAQDDNGGFAAVNTAMNYKLLDKKTYLVPVGNLNLLVQNRNADGSFHTQNPFLKKGYDVPGWQGAQWYPIDIFWVERPCYVIEANAKDRYYNYGKQILYLDQDFYTCYVKDIYSRAGEYWKTAFVFNNIQRLTPDNWKMTCGNYCIVWDHKRRTFSYNDFSEEATGAPTMAAIPLDRINPTTFTTASLIQKSK